MYAIHPRRETLILKTNFMVQSMDLNKMGLTPMTGNELFTIDGGSFWGWLAGVGAAVAVVGLIVASGGLATVGFVAMMAGVTGLIEESVE
ncbi:MAG: hypothetical protein ACK5NK_07445 [Niabella sp.]